MLLVLVLSIAAAMFLAGNAVRVIRILRVPRSLRWELYPIPKGPRERQLYGGSYFEATDWWTKPTQSGCISQLVFVAKEALLLQSVRKNLYDLWLWSWLLHWGLYLYIVAVTTVLSAVVFRSAAVAQLATYPGGIGCMFGWLGSVGLLVLRNKLIRLRPYTTGVTKFNLLFFASFFLTGGLALVGVTAQAYRGTLATSLVSAHAPIVRLHLVLLAFFLAYFPFTHMTHAYMKFFTWHGVRWDDLPAAQLPSSEQALARNLARNLTWAAPHVSEKAETTWAQAVADADGRGAVTRA